MMVYRLLEREVDSGVYKSIKMEGQTLDPSIERLKEVEGGSEELTHMCNFLQNIKGKSDCQSHIFGKLFRCFAVDVSCYAAGYREQARWEKELVLSTRSVDHSEDGRVFACVARVPLFSASEPEPSLKTRRVEKSLGACGTLCVDGLHTVLASVEHHDAASKHTHARNH